MVILVKNTDILINGGVDVQKGLEIFGDMATYDETLETFVIDATAKIKNLEEFLKAKDLNNYAILAHSLKSDAKYFGFSELANLAYNHEMASKSNNDSYVNENFVNLMKECNRIIELSKIYLGLEETTETDEEKTILVVDDSNIIINFVKRVFSDKYNVLIASNGNEAIEIINREKNNLAAMLLDLNMPDADGFVVLNYMKENNLFAFINVSILTGNELLETDRRAFEYPIVDMLKKPFDEAKLLNIISRTIEYNINNN